MGQWSTVLGLVYLALAVSVASITITKAKVSAPLRAWLKRHSSFLGELTSCPYCFSHWLAFGVALAYRPALALSGFWPLDLFVAALVLVALASLTTGLIFVAFARVPGDYHTEARAYEPSVAKDLVGKYR